MSRSGMLCFCRLVCKVFVCSRTLFRATTTSFSSAEKVTYISAISFCTITSPVPWNEIVAGGVRDLPYCTIAHELIRRKSITVHRAVCFVMELGFRCFSGLVIGI